MLLVPAIIPETGISNRPVSVIVPSPSKVIAAGITCAPVPVIPKLPPIVTPLGNTVSSSKD